MQPTTQPLRTGHTTSSFTSSSSSTSVHPRPHPSTSPKTRGITLGGWTVQVTSGNIGSSAEMDALSDLLGIPPPEMAFPHNSLVLHHARSGFRLCFDAVRALCSVEGVRSCNRLEGVDCRDGAVPSSSSAARRKTTATATRMGEKPKQRGGAKSSGGGGIKVAYAQEWGKKRNEAQLLDQQQQPAGTASEATPAQASLNGGELGSGSSSVNASANASHFGPDVAIAAATSGIASAKEYDWTYSCTWAGAEGQEAPPALLPYASTDAASTAQSPLQQRQEQPQLSNIGTRFQPGTDPSRDRIPVERLGPSSGEPILFYDDIVLYEDELADNGSSMVNVKVRVMPSGFLVLQRFFLRVDDVLFRVFDTRLYCQFTEPTAPAGGTASSGTNAERPSEPDLGKLSLGATRNAQRRAGGQDARMDEDDPAEDDEGSWPRLIRECSGSEASYAEVKACLPPYRPHDLSPLTDANWVSNALQTISRRRFQQQQASLASGQTPRLSPAQFGASTTHPTSTGAGAAQAPQPLAYLSGGNVSASRLTGFAGNRPGEKLDLAPARAPAGLGGAELGGVGASGQGARIVGELEGGVAQSGGSEEEGEEDVWIGVGARVDVAVLR